MQEVIKSKIQSIGRFHIFFCFFKMESYGRVKPHKHSYIQYAQTILPKAFLPVFFFFLMSHTNHLEEKSRSYSYSRYLPHDVLSVSKAGIKIHTESCLREEAKFSLCEKPHVPSVSAQPERQKWTESHVSLQSKQNTDFRSFTLQNTASFVLLCYLFYDTVQFTNTIIFWYVFLQNGSYI